MSVEITSQLGDVLLSGNPIWVEVRTGGTIGTDYKCLLRVASTDGKLRHAPYIMGKAPNGTTAVFDISGYVNQPVDYAFEHPQTSKVKSRSMLAFAITVEPGEEYIDTNGDLQTVWSGVTDAHIILKGGLSKFTQNSFQPYQFWDNFISAYKFLTWQPSLRQIAPTSPAKLWFIYPGNDSPTLTLDIKVYYDGEYGFIGEHSQTFTGTENGLFELNLSPTLWSIPTTHATYGNATQMHVNIYKGAVKLTDTYRLVFSHKYFEENTHVYFLNSLGAIDYLWFTGRVQQLTNREVQVVTMPETVSVDLTAGNLKAASVIAQRKWQINTGYKTKEELAALHDFILSKQIWLVQNGVVIPCYLANGDSLLQELQRDLDSLDILLYESNKETYR